MPNDQFYVLDRFNRIMPDGTIIHHSFRRRNCKLTVVGAEYHSVSDGGYREYAILLIVFWPAALIYMATRD